MEADLLYYRRRLAEETAAAAGSDGKVSAAHLELARSYGERIGALEAAHGEMPLHVVSAA